jgi:hypothetical protein
VAQQNEPEEYYYVDARTGIECWHYVNPGIGIKCWIAPPQHQIHLLLNVLADRLADADKLVRELELHKSASGKKQLQLQMIEHYAAQLYFELKHIRDPNEGERRAALAALERLRAAPPGLEEYDRQQAQRVAAEISRCQGLFDDCFKD